MYSVIQSHSNFTSGGVSVAFDAFLPDRNGQRFPAVIGLHGSAGGHASMSDPATMLAEQGFAVYVLHYFDRTGEQPDDLNTMKRHFPAWMKTLWDAVSFVATQPQVDREHIALVGFSLGAYLSLANSTIDDRVKVVVEFFGGLPKEMKFFMRRLCPVLILHGEADPTVPVEEAYQLQKLLEKKSIPHEIKIYPGAGHGFESEVWKDAGERSLQFLRKHLNP